MSFIKRTKEETRAIRDAFLTDYRKVIDKIMDVLDFREEDRMELEFNVVLALQRAINFAKVRTGEQISPQSTSLYKITNILHDVKTWDEYARRVKVALPKEHPEKTLYMYKDLTFKVPFDVPEIATRAMKKEAREAEQKQEMLKVQETILGQTLAQQVQTQEDTIEKLTRQVTTLQNNYIHDEKFFTDKLAHIESKLNDLAKDYIYPLERKVKHLTSEHYKTSPKQPPPYNPELFNKMAEELRSLQKVFGIHSHDDKGEVLVKLKYIK